MANLINYVDNTPTGFVKYYWAAFMWLVLGILWIVILFLAQASPGPSSVLVAFGFIRLGYRELVNGGGGIGSILKIILLVFIWPFWETYRQIRFLMQARSAWKQGNVLIKENGKPLRGA